MIALYLTLGKFRYIRDLHFSRFILVDGSVSVSKENIIVRKDALKLVDVGKLPLLMRLSRPGNPKKKSGKIRSLKVSKRSMSSLCDED